MKTRVICVVIVDDDVRVRSDFRDLLELEPDICVIALAGDGATAIEVCGRLRPDVVVMDIRMPVMNGIEATSAIRAADSGRVLVITTFDLDEYVLGAVRAGASGFLLKDQAPDQLAAAVRTVASGDAIVSPRATARLLAEFVAPSTPAERTHPVLTPREVDVVMLMAEGLSNEEIAVRAGISRATVKTHVSSILTKLGLTTRIQIVVWCYAQEWIPRAPVT